jgi:N-methylhydantoinase B
MANLARPSIAEYGLENLAPGDGLVVNDPHRGGSHLNDFFLISPLFYRNELFGFVANAAHHTDVGGGAPASLGAFTEMYQEGICLPLIKLVERGIIQPDLLKFILANVRAPTEVAGDLRAQVACNDLGIRRISQILDRFGPEEVSFYLDALLSYTERRTRAELAKLPPGVYEAVDCVDDDGISDEPLRLRVQITISDGSITFDWAGTDPQRRGPMNATEAMTASACYFAAKCLIDPDIPVNHGFYHSIDVSAPEGSCLNAIRPAPCVGCWEMLMRVPDMVFKALFPAMPESVPACSKSSVCNLGFGGMHPSSGAYYTFMETIGGGYGGRYASDGPDAITAHIQNTQNAPIEETEINYPVQILRYSLVNDSDGPGKFRGGLGLRRDYRFREHEPSFTFLADRQKYAPWGLAGGMPGKRAEYMVIRDGEEIQTGSKATFIAREGDIVSVRTAGGGGYGKSFERDPQRVLRDVIESKVSVERAKSCYGVIVDLNTESVDEAGTARCRAERLNGSK